MKNNYAIKFIVIFALILVFPVTSLASTRAVQITELITGLINPTTGRILDNHTAFFYVAGTSTPKAVWTEKEKTNPYTEYDLSAIGNIQLYGEGNYKIVIEEYAADDSGAVIYTWDNLRFEFPNYYVHSISSNYNHATEDDFLLVDTSGGNVTVSMLSAASFTHPLRIRRVSGSNSIIIDPDGSETINGSSTLTWTTDVVIEIVSDGSNLVSVGFSSVMADDDNDTKIQVEESVDEDKIRLDTGGTERVVIDSSGLDIQSGGLLIGGSTKISGSSIISGLNFSQNASVQIEDTGSTTDENPLSLVAPNLSNSGYVGLYTGVNPAVSLNAGFLTFYYNSNGSTSNYVGLGMVGANPVLRVDGSGNVGIGKTSGGAKLDVNGEIEGTSLDINGAADIAGAVTGVTNITISGEYDGAILDISGNADIDGTTNLDNTDIDGTVDISSTLDIGLSTTRRVAPAGEFVNDGQNAYSSSTSFDIDANIGPSWESIGPTGSGADNIWTALDSVPVDADWIIIRVYAQVSTGATPTVGDEYTLSLCTCSGVGSCGCGGQSVQITCELTAQINTDNLHCNDVGEIYVPLSSSIFEMYVYSDFPNETTACWLVGWGFNP